MERYILYRRVEQRLAAKGVEVDMSFVGHYCTSIDMVGASPRCCTWIASAGAPSPSLSSRIPAGGLTSAIPQRRNQWSSSFPIA